MSTLFTFSYFLTGGPSFGLYDISKSLTIPGWIVILILPLLLILGIVSILKLFRKNRGKLK